MREDSTDSELTHVDKTGKAQMVDVTAKTITLREAEARGSVTMSRSAFKLVLENAAGKGDVLGVARIAGILAAKQTEMLIPLCHSLPLTGVDVAFHLDEAESRVDVIARVRTEAKTGVEMEALTAVSISALTIYDMCKAVDRGMTIDHIRVTKKSGGRTGPFEQD
jgi:molybdenum cofactor biosynthesis protein MoaC